jgi:hypothetical protein
MPLPLDSFPLDRQPGPGSQVDLTLAGHHDEPRMEPRPTPSPKRRGQALALGSVAAISAAVALLAVWLLGQSGTTTIEEDAAVTVSYEPLDARGDGDADRAVLDGGVDEAATPRGTSAANHDARSTQAETPASRRVQPSNAAAASKPVDAPPPSSATGLAVITTPPGARVTVNGVGWGSAPLTLGNLPEGTKRVRVSLAGYESEERIVAADISQTKVTLRIRLRAVPPNDRSQ